MNYLEAVKKSKLRFAIPGIADSLLRGFCRCAELNYVDFDSAKFTYDQHEVAENVFEALELALSSLANNKSPKKQKVPGWSYGYICGHAQKQLSVLWTGIYIIETRREFSDIVNSRAVSELLNIDDLALEKFGILFEHYNTTGHKFNKIKEDLPSNVVSLLSSEKRRSKARESKRKEVVGYFHGLFMTGYKSMLKKYDVECCPDLTYYIAEEVLIEMIGKEHFATFGS